MKKNGFRKMNSLIDEQELPALFIYFRETDIMPLNPPYNSG